MNKRIKKKKSKLIHNSKNSTKSSNLVHLSVNTCGVVRNETLENREYTVVPMVMLVEGVLNGSSGALLYPEEELSKAPLSWNMKPVVVRHPVMNGHAVSATLPEVIESYKIGMIMNTTYFDKKLRAEAWLEKERLGIVDNGVIQQAIDNNQILELSTGVFTENEDTSGSFNGVTYNAIARNYRPDHLAILPDEIGACSVADGAGFLRINTSKSGSLQQKQELAEFLGVFNNVAYQDRRTHLRTLLKAELSTDTWIYIEDIFTDYIVFEYDDIMYKRTYNLVNDVPVLTGVNTKVMRKVSYIDVTEPLQNNNNKETIKMDKTKLVESLIANSVTSFTEDDTEMLMKMDEKVLQKMIPKVEPIVNTKVEPTTETKTTVEKVKDATAKLPEDVQAFINNGMNALKKQKQTLVDIIVANADNKLSKDTLESLDVDALQNISDMLTPISTTDFSGCGNPITNTNTGTKIEPLVSPVWKFEKENK